MPQIWGTHERSGKWRKALTLRAMTIPPTATDVPVIFLPIFFFSADAVKAMTILTTGTDVPVCACAQKKNEKIKKKS